MKNLRSFAYILLLSSANFALTPIRTLLASETGKILTSNNKEVTWSPTVAELPSITSAPQKSALSHLDRAYKLALLVTEPQGQSSVLRQIALIHADTERMVYVASAYAEAGKDYQSLLDGISDPKIKLKTTIDFHLLKVRQILPRKLI